jgi:DNA-binding transcriptional ArsR family regulator
MSKNYRDKLKVTIGRTSLRVPKGIVREETVKSLLNETPRTREELNSLTGYGEDTVGAVLAKLYDLGLVKIQKESRRFELKSPRNTVMARTSLAA